MKKILFCIVLISAGFTLKGQIGLRGGINYSDVTIEGLTNVTTDSKIGIHAGLQGYFQLGGLLNIRPAVLYNIKGSKVDAFGAAGNNSLHYLEVPINLGLKFGSDSFGIVLEGGPYFGYLMNISQGLFSDVDKSDWGANFGAVVELDNLGIGLNYSNSLSGANGGASINQAFKLKNGNIAAFVYFKL